jgi:hypothetical protein
MNGCSAIDIKDRNKGDEWAGVMKLAEKYGFIRFAYGALLC